MSPDCRQSPGLNTIPSNTQNEAAPLCLHSYSYRRVQHHSYFSFTFQNQLTILDTTVREEVLMFSSRPQRNALPSSKEPKEQYSVRTTFRWPLHLLPQARA